MTTVRARARRDLTMIDYAAVISYLHRLPRRKDRLTHLRRIRRESGGALSAPSHAGSARSGSGATTLITFPWRAERRRESSGNGCLFDHRAR